MFFALSKLLTALILPSNVAALLVASGLALMLARPQKARLAKKMMAAGVAMTLLLGLSPLGNALVYVLEQRAVAITGQPPAGPVTGIVMLGGFEDGWVSAGRGGLAVNETAERLTETVRLARLHPEAKIVFSGGVARLLTEGEGGAGAVQRYLLDIGIAADRIIVEAKARNTHENATLTRDLVRPRPQDVWLLVTSAYHMPRSVGIFRKAGFTVLPYPVDFRTRDGGDALKPFDTVADGLKRVDLAVREYIGLLAYRVTGRTDSLWPGPR